MRSMGVATLVFVAGASWALSASSEFETAAVREEFERGVTHD